jgi:hypothetical protein
MIRVCKEIARKFKKREKACQRERMELKRETHTMFLILHLQEMYTGAVSSLQSQNSPNQIRICLI